MPRSRALATDSHRALATLACYGCALLGFAFASVARCTTGAESNQSTAAPEAWQLVTEASPTDEQLPEMSLPNDEESELLSDVIPFEEYGGEAWQWHWLPGGLIYHTYMAGPSEPRMALVTFYEASNERSLWDATLGGRVGIVQYGNGDPFHPDGFQLDFYGAAIARLDVENQQDLDSTDYVFGLPLTWGDERLQFQCGYAHISSHLGDEFAIRNPGTLASRINYVRDSINFGTSYYAVPALRLYADFDWAFHRSGGAEAIHLEFGSELSKPGPTFDSFTPFAAVNGRMRQENDFGGDLSVQAGWLRRGLLGQTLRFAGHYYNGKSSQAQFFDTFEQQIGLGVWYDF